MDWRPTVLKKYWEGRSSLEEEHRLREQLSAQEEDCDYFQSLQEFSEMELPEGFEDKIMASLETEAKVRPMHRKLWKFAAAAVIFLGVGITFMQQNQAAGSSNEIVYDDPAEALEFTKQALMMFSTKMNEGMSYTYSLQEFDGAMQKVKNNNSK